MQRQSAAGMVYKWQILGLHCRPRRGVISSVGKPWRPGVGCRTTLIGNINQSSFGLHPAPGYWVANALAFRPRYDGIGSGAGYSCCAGCRALRLINRSPARAQARLAANRHAHWYSRAASLRGRAAQHRRVSLSRWASLTTDVPSYERRAWNDVPVYLMKSPSREQLESQLNLAAQNVERAPNMVARQQRILESLRA